MPRAIFIIQTIKFCLTKSFQILTHVSYCTFKVLWLMKALLSKKGAMHRNTFLDKLYIYAHSILSAHNCGNVYPAYIKKLQ